MAVPNLNRSFGASASLRRSTVAIWFYRVIFSVICFGYRLSATHYTKNYST